MKRFLILLIAVAVVAGLSTAAMAVVEGTHHDMRTYIGTSIDTCYPCHGFKPGATDVQDAALKNVGSMCYTRCHVGATGVATNFPLASAFPEIGVWDNTTNRLEIGTYSGTNIDKYRTGHLMTLGIPAPDAAASMTATGWPYVTAAGGLQCTSCHDVHSNTYTPFIRAPLSDNTTRANAFCHRCHGAVAQGAARWSDLSGSNTPNGSHPSEADWQNAPTRNTNNRLGRTIEFKDVNATSGTTPPTSIGDNGVFRNYSYSGTALNSSANHYNPGGKLGDFGLAGNVGCYTCHATHLPTAAGLPQLIVAQYRAAGTRTQSDMCVGCHGSIATEGRNPGITSFWHPVDRETRVVDFTTPATAVYQGTTGTINIVVNMSGVYDNGVGGLLSCMSCHSGTVAGASTASYGVHDGPASTSLISPARPTCGSCHNAVGAQMGTAANSHHVYGTSTNYSGAAWGYPSSVTYSTGFSANLADGLSCEDCHPGNATNSTAHNWN